MCVGVCVDVHLDSIQQFAHAPKRIRFDAPLRLQRQSRHLKVLHVLRWKQSKKLKACVNSEALLPHTLTDKLRQEDNKKGRDQIVDALHVAAGGVADRPGEEDSLKDLKKTEQPSLI